MTTARHVVLGKAYLTSDNDLARRANQ